MNNTEKYGVLYKPHLVLTGSDSIKLDISSSDIVSIAIINNYDTMTYPIVRFRLYTDINTLQVLSENHDDIGILCNMSGGVYNLSNDSPILVTPTQSISISLKGYIENKNTPTSIMDQYVDGIKKENDLNNNRKVPIEVYGYDDRVVHMMKQKSQSIYRDTSLLTAITDMFHRANIYDLKIDVFDNQTKYEQILIPNLNISKSLAFLDTNYGLYKKGTQIFGDIDSFYISNADVNNGTKPLPIYVMSTKTVDDNSGMQRLDKSTYRMTTMFPNVSVISETDIEQIMNSPEVVAVNIKNLRTDTNRLNKLYRNKDDITINTPDKLHCTNNEFITDTYIARVNEKITRVDVSGVGFDVAKLKINTRYNLIFESPIRGMSMNEFYRATYVCNVFTNLDSGLFVAQTTMNLCSN